MNNKVQLKAESKSGRAAGRLTPGGRSAWSAEMDASLRAQKGAGKQWRAIVVAGMTELECRKRWDALRATEASDRLGGERPAARSATAGATKDEKEPELSERDGLLWLVKKRRLSLPRLRAAQAYRELYRTAMTEDGALKSCLEVAGGGGERVGMPGAAPISLLAAKRALFLIRHKVLGGQADMLSVMDGVCGAGRTLRELGKGDRGAGALEAVLMVALDLVHGHLTKQLEKAA